MRAYGAQESYKRDAPLAPFDSPAGAVARAYATGLDALTLRLRAVASLVRIDAVRARQLFEGIDFYLPPAACDSMLVPVADEYYGTLATIARRTFADTADGHADALRFFEIYLWRTHVPSEIPAVLKAVKAMRLPRVEAGYFEEALDAMMEHIDRDARGFSTYGLDIVPLMSELADMDRLAGVLGEILMRAERKLLVGAALVGALQRQPHRDADCRGVQHDCAAKRPAGRPRRAAHDRRRVAGQSARRRPDRTILADHRCATSAVRAVGAARCGRRTAIGHHQAER